MMVEHPDTVAQPKEMAAVPTIDGFYIGLSDLTVAMGLPAATCRDDPRHQEICQTVLDVATAHGLVAGVHCGGPEEAADRFMQGFRFCPVANDVALISAGSASAMEAARGAVPELVPDLSGKWSREGY